MVAATPMRMPISTIIGMAIIRVAIATVITAAESKTDYGPRCVRGIAVIGRRITIPIIRCRTVIRPWVAVCGRRRRVCRRGSRKCRYRQGNSETKVDAACLGDTDGSE